MKCGEAVERRIVTGEDGGLEKGVSSVGMAGGGGGGGVAS